MIVIDITTKTKKWPDLEKFIKKTCLDLISLTSLKKFLKKNFTLEIAISLVSDPQIKKINFEFRNKNKATNVLSFPSYGSENEIEEIAKTYQYLFLGDIIISFDSIKKESIAQKKKFEHHLTHLILHSILHLIGHDHIHEEMAKKMENLEITILKKLNINNPYT